MKDPARHSHGTILCAGTAAAFAAVTPAALLMSAASGNLWLFLSAYLFGVPLALVHSWALGLPAYFVLREHWDLTWTRAALGGLVVGALPATILFLAVGGRATGALGMAGSTGLLGAAGGLGFRAYLLFLE